MSADFFLWGGFGFSLLWHLIFWILLWVVGNNRRAESDEKFIMLGTNLGLSGVALCCFGYLVFS